MSPVSYTIIELPIQNQPKIKPSSKQWKHLARDGKLKQTPGLAYSPFQRMLWISLSPRKHPKSNTSPPIVAMRGKISKKGEAPRNPCQAFAALSWLLKKYSPDIVLLSKTKLYGSKIGRCGVLFGYDNYFCVGFSGGLLLLWRDSCSVNVLSFSLGHIDARVVMENGYCWRFIGFYGDPNPNKIVFLWNLLRRLKEMDDLPWVCGGDFNELLSVHDKVGGLLKSFIGMSNFRQAIEECNLSDLGYTGPRHTWNNKREGKSNIRERIDMFLAKEKWRDRFVKVKVDHMGFFSSDTVLFI
ncbi:hypothetical protein LWI28_027648 [Acer negundo]|uniref:Endonuclease/exonuclease/phosphatase domain-containing protein n=1 Tax=Acer negundo TaxID=4023 RepID=A0AAD5NXY5_ACENE|nr:hypothetical protein LWI28_027648 [Acer negundo]